MPMTSKGFPVLLTFDIDAETMWTSRDPKNAERPIVLSQGAYGWKRGMPRILDLLDRYGLKVTFFVPGLVMEQRPALVETILKQGHEIAHHSWSHAWIVNLTLEQEREPAPPRLPTGYSIRAFEHAGDVVGAAVLVHEPEDGWVEQLAVARAHRGRGLGRALLDYGAGVTWRRGVRRFGLGTDSRTGARGLYEHLGMHVRRSFILNSKPLAPGASG